jgi:hypothetical protein
MFNKTDGLSKNPLSPVGKGMIGSIARGGQNSVNNNQNSKKQWILNQNCPKMQALFLQMT